MSGDAPVNAGAVSWPDPYPAGIAVRRMQTKLHLWAARDAGRRFDEMRCRFCDTGWRFACNGVVFTGASSVKVTRYRYRGSNIPTPWTPTPAAALTSG